MHTYNLVMVFLPIALHVVQVLSKNEHWKISFLATDIAHAKWVKLNAKL